MLGLCDLEPLPGPPGSDSPSINPDAPSQVDPGESPDPGHTTVPTPGPQPLPQPVDPPVGATPSPTPDLQDRCAGLNQGASPILTPNNLNHILEHSWDESLIGKMSLFYSQYSSPQAITSLFWNAFGLRTERWVWNGSRQKCRTFIQMPTAIGLDRDGAASRLLEMRVFRPDSPAGPFFLNTMFPSHR